MIDIDKSHREILVEILFSIEKSVENNLDIETKKQSWFSLHQCAFNIKYMNGSCSSFTIPIEQISNNLIEYS